MKFIKTTIMNIRVCSLVLIILIGTINFVKAQDKPGEFPDNVDTADCTSQAKAKVFDIKKKWETYDPGPNGDYAHSAATPLVGDLDGDGKPEVLSPWYKYGADIYGGTSSFSKSSRTTPNTWNSYNISVYEGKDGTFKYTIKTPLYSVDHQAITIADVDKDGKAEIFVLGLDNIIYCYDGSKANTGSNDYKWKSSDPSAQYHILMTADINNDGIPELVCGPDIYNAVTGKLLVRGEFETDGTGFCDPTCADLDSQYATYWRGFPGHMQALADVDGDNHLELCAGNTIYKIEINNPNGEEDNAFYPLIHATKNSNVKVYDGATLVVDFDNDGDLDVVVVGQTSTAVDKTLEFKKDYNPYAWDAKTGEIIAYAYFSKIRAVSVPFAGDVNGDGYCELIFNGYQNGSASNPDMMHVYKYDKTAQGNMKLLFNSTQASPYTESAGYTVFDFNQDGQDEIIFRGTDKFFILDGKTLQPLTPAIATASNTCSEYPIVADVDCDGHADILFTERFDKNSSARDARGKVICYESKTPGAWGPARKVWNQWPYNVVNINEDMTVPKYQFNVATVFPNGTKPFNAFLRQQTKINNKGEMFATAPNAHLIPNENALTKYCDSITIDIKFTNKGTEKIVAPYGLVVYKDQYRSNIIFQKNYTSDLEVGDTMDLHLTYTEATLSQWSPVSQFVVTINDIGQGIAEEGGQQSECDTTDNKQFIPFDGFITSETATVTHHMCEGESYSIGNSTYTEEGEYVDTLVNRYGCDSIVTSYVYVHPISVDLGPDQSYCSNDFSQVTLDASGNGATNFEWQDGSSNPTFVVRNDGSYSVVVSNEYGCKDSSSVYVHVIPNPIVTISKNPDDFCEANSTTLTAHASEPDCTFQWNNGATSENVIINQHGTYTVIADNQGCTGTASIQIEICPCEVWVPNAFTPDGDGINDVFLPKVSSNLNSYQLYIYNRWGEEVFSTTDQNEAWDGSYKGKDGTNNLFTFYLIYTCASDPDKKISKKGFVTLIL